MPVLSWDQIRNTWVSQGGAAARADIAAAVALAESSGRTDAQHHNAGGSWDNGLWQINRPFRDHSLDDQFANARVAIAMSHNGTTWRAWCTAYSDGACGKNGGIYMGAGTPALNRLHDHGGSLLGGGGALGGVLQTGPAPQGAPEMDYGVVLDRISDQIAFAADAARNAAAGLRSRIR